MFEANLKIIEELKQFVTLVKDHWEIREKFAVTDTAFTRNRKLTFDRLALMICSVMQEDVECGVGELF